jgi:hypothetical protein
VGKAAINDLLDQYRRAFRMLYAEIERFNAQQWVTGLSDFQVPVRIAMHTMECLDYYFSGKNGDQYPWGHHFAELPAGQLPTQDALAAYAREIEERVVAELGSLSDEDLSKRFEIDDSASTLLGHYVYAIRHTMHHHGELAVLSIYHGNEGGSWA